MAARKQKQADRQDVVFVHSATDDGNGARVIRLRDKDLQVGEVRPLEEGRPVQGEVVTLKPRTDSPRLFDVKVEHIAPAAPSRSGPARIATASYRSGWNAIWGKSPRRKPQQLN